MEKSFVTYTAEENPKVSKVYADVRKRLSEDVLEYLNERYKKAVRISNTEIGVLVGEFIDEDGFPHDVCGVVKVQAKPYYEKTVDENGNELSRPVEQFILEDKVDAYEKDQKAKGVPKK